MNNIYIDGLEIELAPNQPLGLELTSPHLLYDRIVGRKASLPPFPLTKRNNVIFGYYNEPQSGSILQRRLLTHIYNGHLIQEGTFLLTEAGPAGYTGLFVDNYGELFGDYTNKPLTELSLGTLTVPSTLTPTISDGSYYAVAFPTILNPDFYGDNGAGIGYNGRVNHYDGGYAVNTPKVPMVFLKYLFQRLEVLTGVKISGSFFTHPAYQNLILYNTQALDGATTITIARHLPELTPAQLLIELRKLLNLRYDIDLVAKTLVIGFWQDALLQPAAIDWSSKAVGKPTKTPESNTRIQLSFSLDSGDGLMKDKPAELEDYLTPGTDPGIAKITTAFSTLLEDTTSGTAKTRQIGITSQFAQLSNTFAPRLLFWKGLSSGIPKAGPTQSTYSLFWNGTNGLRANQWAIMEALRAGQFYAKQDLLLNETDLATLDWAKKVHINGMDYLVASLAGSLPITGPFQALLVRV